ncbi:MAG: hypothetical protein AAGI30_05875 [Planctomycetota bacterium]
MTDPSPSSLPSSAAPSTPAPRAFALTLAAYGVAVVLIGGLTSAAAPPEANAATALIVTGAAAVLAFVLAALSAFAPPGRVISFVGIHAGLVLPVLLILGTAPRALSTLGASPDEAAEFAETDNSEHQDDGDRGYQAVGLGSVAVLSGFTVVALISHRPKPR